MTPEQEERFIVAFENCAKALNAVALTNALRFRKDFPEEKPKRAAEITRTNDDKRDQYSDRADPDWFEETQERAPSRFQKKFDEDNPKPKARSPRTSQG